MDARGDAHAVKRFRNPSRRWAMPTAKRTKERTTFYSRLSLGTSHQLLRNRPGGPAAPCRVREHPDGCPTSILLLGFAATPRNRARELMRYNAAIRGFTSPAESFRPAGTIHQRYDRGSINDNLHLFVRLPPGMSDDTNPAVINTTSAAKCDTYYPHVPNTCFPGPKPFTALDPTSPAPRERSSQSEGEGSATLAPIPATERSDLT
ncbi:hypothetical protein LF1_31200 [Rubripirellula obstinata]|uniref:Uncharacterized protein n=1 Tax=Rubripirellula obstinata TaxID=406547 RepID=A0A5B1CM13_9BACT|nr:hypothetical protein LF1_31200 [Rubripirellula obstinata]